MNSPVNLIGITVGTECNIRCRHCLVDAKLASKRITIKEIALLNGEIGKYSPKLLIFTGGEPTLYTEEINEITSSLKESSKTEIKIVTNGQFAKTADAAREVLGRFRALTGVAVSYDKFHAEFVPESSIRNLIQACGVMGLPFSIMCAIESPLDLTILNGLKLSGTRISTQKVLPIAKAKKNSLKYEYPEFDEKTLGKKCPNLGGIMYNCGSGFTICCGFLASGGDKSSYVHRTIGGHLRSRFHQLISKHSFGQLLRLAGTSRDQLLPKHSDPCTICSLLVPRLLRGS